MAESIRIREATRDQIPALATLHVKVWNDTYGVQPGEGPTFETRQWQWNELFKEKGRKWFVLLVENETGNLIGFAKGLAYDHPDLPDFNGELNKIYLLRDYQRKGIGRKLMSAIARRFIDMGISNMVLFGDQNNPACAFHEAMGGERLYAPNGEFHGGYCWRDLQKLVL